MSLNPSTTYYYRVKAVTATSESDYSDTISVTTLDDPTELITPSSPSPPLIHKLDIQPNQIIFNIVDNPDNEQILEYKLTLSTTSDYSNLITDKLIYLIDINTSSYFLDGIRINTFNFSGLNSDTTYYYKLACSNRVAISSELTGSFITPHNIQSTQLIGVTNLSSISATLNWNEILTIDGYNLDLSTQSNFSTLILNSQAVAGTSFVVNGLIQDTTYYARVRVRKNGLFSLYSNTLEFKTLTGSNTANNLTLKLSKPLIQNISDISVNSIKFYWSDIKNATSYSIDISTESNFSTFVFQNLSTANNFINIDNLLENTLYYIRIKAVNSLGESDYSTLNLQTLSFNSSLVVPQALANSEILSTAFRASWTKRNYANKYLVQVATNNTFTANLLNYFTADVDNLLIENLIPNTVYFYRVFALTNLISSNASNTLSITTTGILPNIIVNSPTELSDTTIRFNWTTNNAYTKYLITIFEKFTGKYLGNGFYFRKDIGDVNTFYLDIFLEPNTTYSYYLTGISTTGDEFSTLIQDFITFQARPKLYFADNNTALTWDNLIDSLEVSYDKDFKNLLSGYTPKTLNTNTILARKIKLDNLLVNNISNLYFRIYNSSSKLFSNSLYIYDNLIPIVQLIKLTNNSVEFNWKYNQLTKYKIQLKIKSGGTYVPVVGFTYPLDIDTDLNYTFTNLTANNEYSFTLYYFEEGRYKETNSYLFKTNTYSNINLIPTNNSLIAPTLTFSNIEFDRFTINLTGYTKYVIEISLRSDFLTTLDYIESTLGIYTYCTNQSNSVFYVRAVGIEANQRSLTASNTATTSNIVESISVISAIPSINQIQVLSEYEAIINWTLVNNATDYVIEVSNSNTFNYLNQGVTIEKLSNNSALLSGLNANSYFYARVYGFNKNSISKYSNSFLIDTSL